MQACKEHLPGRFDAACLTCLQSKECNEALAIYGPENTRCYDRIQVKLRTGQQTAVIKSNIHVSSMSGE